MESRLNVLRIFGLPVQFVVVVALSLALTIYFGAYAADARVNARAAQSAQQFEFSASASDAASARLSGGIAQRAPGDGASGGLGGNADAPQPAERQTWEYLFLIACPLH